MTISQVSISWKKLHRREILLLSLEYPTHRLRLYPCQSCGRQFNVESLVSDSTDFTIEHIDQTNQRLENRLRNGSFRRTNIKRSVEKCPQLDAKYSIQANNEQPIRTFRTKPPRKQHRYKQWRVSATRDSPIIASVDLSRRSSRERGSSKTQSTVASESNWCECTFLV